MERLGEHCFLENRVEPQRRDLTVGLAARPPRYQTRVAQPCMTVTSRQCHRIDTGDHRSAQHSPSSVPPTAEHCNERGTRRGAQPDVATPPRAATSAQECCTNDRAGESPRLFLPVVDTGLTA
ncbi:hypothetical protein MTO96_003760 [Rhipicephalus appendiculatus]